MIIISLVSFTFYAFAILYVFMVMHLKLLIVVVAVDNVNEQRCVEVHFQDFRLHNQIEFSAIIKHNQA